MITENYKEKAIQFKRGMFIDVCKQLDALYGPKGEGWFNVMCLPSGDTETMTIRYIEAITTISKWDAFNIIVEDNDLKWDEFTELEGFKSEYEIEDIKTFLKINGK